MRRASSCRWVPCINFVPQNRKTTPVTRARLSNVLAKIIALAEAGKAVSSQHGYARMDKRGILFDDVLRGVADGDMIEEYPDAHLGPSVLVLQLDQAGNPLHVVWGLAKGTDEPAVIVTAYHPNSKDWSEDFRERKS